MPTRGTVKSSLRSSLPLTATLLILALLVSFPSTCPAQSGLELKILEVVGYNADLTAPDRPSIAVRQDGLVRVAISDLNSFCCPQVVPLKVATRDANGNWTYLEITNYSDQLTAGFLPTGDLGVTYLEFSGSDYGTMLARVGDTSATLEAAPSPVPGNPGGYVRMLPWVVDSDGNLQAVSSIAAVRLKRDSGGWNSVGVPSQPHDIAVGRQHQLFILTAAGVYSFETNGLNEQGILTKIVISQSGNLAADALDRLHVASLSTKGSLLYKLLEKNRNHPIEIVAQNVAEMLNHQSMVADSAGRPYVIYSNSSGHLVVARRRPSGWAEEIDLGFGQYGSIVLGPLGTDLHAAFAGSDGVARYAKLAITTTAALASPKSLGFGTILLGKMSAGKIVTLRNLGPLPLSLAKVSTTGDFTQTNTCPGSMLPDTECSITVKFAPTGIGDRPGTLTIDDNADGSPQVVGLDGTGTEVKLSPKVVNFGMVTKGTTATRSLTLTNVGSTALGISNVNINGIDAQDFSTPVNPPCGGAVAPGAACAISVQFTPSRTGQVERATLLIQDDGGGSPQKVNLSGTGK